MLSPNQMRVMTNGARSLAGEERQECLVLGASLGALLESGHERILEVMGDPEALLGGGSVIRRLKGAWGKWD